MIDDVAALSAAINGLEDSATELHGQSESVRQGNKTLDYISKELSEAVESMRRDFVTNNKAASASYTEGSEDTERLAISLNPEEHVPANTDSDTELLEISAVLDECISISADFNDSVKAKGKSLYKDPLFYIVGAVIAAAMITLILYVPFTGGIFLPLSLCWLALSFYKKPIKIAGYEIRLSSNRLLPVIASVVSIASIILLLLISNLL